MRANEFTTNKIHNHDKLDDILAHCVKLVYEKNRSEPSKYGKVAACIIDSKNRKVFGINMPGANGTRRHAERVAIDKYHERYGKIHPGAIIVTTLSPCNRDMAERDGPSCQDLLLQNGIEKVYTGYMDPSQHSDHPFSEEVTKNDDLWEACKKLSDSFVHDDLTESFGVEVYPGVIPFGEYLGPEPEFAPPGNYRDAADLHDDVYDLIDAGVEPEVVTINPKQLLATQDWLSNAGGDDPLFDEYTDKPVVYRKAGKFYILDGHHRSTKALKAGRPIAVYLFTDAQLNENFHDGKVKGKSRPGRVKRAGASCDGSVTDLRQRAKNASGEKAKMYHWCANMKSGRNK